MSKKKLRPCGRHVFIEMILPAMVFGDRGLWSQQSPNPSSCEGIIIGAGPECTEVATGDRVIYNRVGNVRELDRNDTTKIEVVEEEAVLCKIE